jgi:fatty acid desaturase
VHLDIHLPGGNFLEDLLKNGSLVCLHAILIYSIINKIGASMVAWHNQHVVGHHVYTNIMGADPDLPVSDQGDLRRIVKRQVWSHFYRYQHIYMPLLYGFLTVKV